MLKCFGAVAFVVSLFSAALWGQSISGSIVGSVADSSEAAVAGAEVTLVQKATGARRTARTGVQGDFVFGTLAPGEYTLTVRFTGFKSFTKDGINLSAAERLPVGTLTLQVGEVSDSITVDARGAVVQTASAERAGSITSSQVDQIAIRGRNVMELLQLLPGVVNNSNSDVIARNWNLNVNGNRQNTTSMTFDGMATNAIGNNNNSVIMISQDAVAEVKVLLTNYQAEYGRMSGANVQLVSKSGAREFHGGGSYYKRHEQFNANNFFNNQVGAPVPRYRYNTFNYNLGGPVYIPGKFNRQREKIFFFWNQEFWPLKTATALQRLTVPTPLEKNGDFSQTVDLNNRMIVIRDPAASVSFPGNAIPKARLNSSGQALLGVFPAPNYFDRAISGGRYNYIYQGEDSQPKRTATLKTDFNLDSNNLVTVNYSWHGDSSQGPFVGHDMRWGILNQKRTFDGKAIIGSYKRVFSPTLVNELNAGFIDRPEEEINGTSLDAVQRDKVGFRVSQFNSQANPLNLLPEAVFTGVNAAAQIGYDGRFPLHTTHKIFTVNDNLTKTLHSHTFKAGFYYDFYWRGASDNSIIPTGRFDFGRDVNNPLDTNYAYSNTVLGIFRSYTETASKPFAEWRLSNIEWFVQDAWKLTRRFTLDYGMRFMAVVPIYETGNRVAGFLPSAWNPARKTQLIQPAMVGGRRVGMHPVTGQVYPVTAIGAVAPGVGNPLNGMVSPLTDSSLPRGLVRSRGVQYAPRFGFAWDVAGNGKTAVRGGFGMFYNRQNLDAQILNHAFMPPLVDNPVVNNSTLDTFLNSRDVASPQNVLGIDTIGKLPTVYNWSLTVQRDIGFGTVLDAGYVGSVGRHLMWQRDINIVPLGANFDPANIDPTTRRAYPKPFLVPYTGYNNVDYREWASSSNYHSMQVTVNRRFARGLQFGAAWTWSKAMDYNSGDTNSVSALVPVRVWNYGLSDFDRTHILKINWLWDVPKAPLANAVLDRVVNGWQLSGIASFVSGNPMSVGYGTTTAIDITGTPTQGARIVVLGSPVLPKSERTFDRYFDTEVFRLPAVGTFGNAARTLLRGPGVNNWDIALFKNIPVREKMRFQFRWETYNTFNHTQFSGLDTTARFDPATGEQVNARFGELTGARDARIMQLALRFLF
ncbi:MAG: carboxypeptidase regulatory-like domain-containing protein [Acidobacteria bacterium]|nr:carboxypeptidase regulatory-like domain-containing protein [Acidobacteriota bacterium]